MKTIYLIRHSYASKSFRGLDFSRPLKEKGKKVAEFIGKQLKKENILPDLILTSAAERTLQTSRILANEVGFNFGKILPDKNLYGANETDMLNEINQLNDKLNSVFIVGHNPTISGMVTFLTGESPMALSPGSVIKIVFDLESWKHISFNSGSLQDKFLPRSYEELQEIIG